MEDRKYVDVDGYRIPPVFSPKALRDFLEYKPRDDDVFVVTFPKCGTTWMQYIVYLIYHNGEIAKTREEPYSPNAKYIYVARNPKDCCVSFYFFAESFPDYNEFSGGSFDDFFELFIEGKHYFGEYFDNLLSWYEHRNDPNVLSLTYEEMKADTAGVVLKVARFIGETYLESDENLLQKIVENSSVKNMKVVANEFTKDLASQLDPAKMTPAMKHIYQSEMDSGKKEKAAFRMVRKGIVGDWRNAMTEDQVSRLDEKTEKRLGGTELLKYWKEIEAV